ncbi:phosphoglycerate mutase-like protein [Tilletiaria anomala UBC 951]|uniref:Phosphoglycerate mutase-like protein n=1 Tax=Tilletiaria anomala (strain ATCC 24038 / CBS 436.72 / UBC 951) TaxID=1037660 RepID=A0A066V8D8_TILAU|nr:phosphoglycerate mutase-like protein [Tilletiaria anomala UBC 951]KDN36558.1 phosphoglycerate mutase-like protein [Tilletiaria anomala UBC 951]
MSCQGVRILLMRHGETEENRQRIIQGQLDTDLNEAGRLQAYYTGRHLANTKIDEVYSSPLKRARDTALAVIKQNKSFSNSDNVTSTFTDARLMEQHLGVLQGKPGAGRRHGEPEGAESAEEVCARFASFWNDVLSNPGPWPIQGADDGKASKEQADVQLLDHTKFQPPVPQHLVEESEGTSPAEDTKGCKYARTVLVVSHGSALTNLFGGVLLREEHAVVASGVEPGRFANCSITEIIYPSRPSGSINGSSHVNHTSLPSTTRRSKRFSAILRILKASTEAGKGTIVRWSDVSHLPHRLETQLVANVDETIGKALS